jgi:uncharacterized damage-inducible protein DinB
MIDATYLADLLHKAHFDHPWHGPSLIETLRGLTPAQAAAHPIPGAHSIWELVLHLAAWQGEVTRRLEGKAPALPDEGDWPAVGEVSEAAWLSALGRLGETLLPLKKTLGRLTDADLDRPTGSLSRTLGTGSLHRTMVVGLLQHAAYHSGQIVLLRKALPG